MDKNNLENSSPIKDPLEERKPFLLELGKMVNKLVHDARNPISAIKGFTSLLEKDLEGQPKLKSLTGNIMKATESLEVMIDRILAFSRPMKLTLTKLDFVLLIRQVKKEFTEKHPESPLLEVEIEPDTLPLPFDMIRMKDALHHLLDNAAEALPDGGKIRMTLQKADPYARITVEDGGKGIAADKLHEVWIPLYSTKKNGAGFGLPMTKKIVEGHGGHVELKSREGEGTKVTIHLPLEGDGNGN